MSKSSDSEKTAKFGDYKVKVPRPKNSQLLQNLHKTPVVHVTVPKGQIQSSNRDEEEKKEPQQIVQQPMFELEEKPVLERQDTPELKKRSSKSSSCKSYGSPELDSDAIRELEDNMT